MADTDPVRSYLRLKGAPYSVITRGLRGLVENWERIADMVTAGYSLTLEDYLNDMDGRQLLQNGLGVAPPELRDAFLDRVRAADERMKALVIPAGRCLWGAIVASEEGWKEDTHWWYFTRPQAPGPGLRAELERHGSGSGRRD